MDLSVMGLVLDVNNLASWLIVIIILACVVAIFWVATKQLGIQVPGWAVQIFWIVVLAFVAIGAIRFLLTL